MWRLLKGWTLQGLDFVTDMMILPLGGCEMVLGIQWLATLGNIHFNFQKLTAKFEYANSKVLLRRTQSYVKWMQGPEVKLNSMTLCVYPSTLLSLEAANGSCAKHPCSKIQTLLKEYEDVFSMPNALPSKRSHDHHIPLISNASPVNIKPYRHPPNQKDAIELMAKELLDSWSLWWKLMHVVHGAMLQQEGHPIDYLSKALSAKHQSYLTYEKEFLVVILALEKWRGYLMDKHFKIKTDHFSLKYLLDQRVTTLFQAKWLPKLSGYDYEISYKKGSHNVVANALSRVPSSLYRDMLSSPKTALLKKNAFNWSDEATESFHALQQAMVKSPVLALPNFNKEFTIETDASGYGVGAVLQQEGHPIAFLNSNELVEAVKATWSSDPTLRSVILSLQQGHSKNSRYTWSANELRRKGKLVVGNDEQLRLKLVSHFHESPTGGHSGVQATMKRLAAYFYWKGLKKMVKQQIHLCDICQRNKPDLAAYPGLLQPLQIPTKVWQDISMDFIEALPLSQNKSVILVVVDRLSKYAHFIPLSHPYTASNVAQAFLDNVYKLHGLPSTIVSDRDKVFLSLFWQSLFKMLKVQLCMSTAYHPQSDGQTEAVNKCVETYLRCMTGERPREWIKWLSLAEYWYNTNFHSSIKTTPFEVLYGQPPPVHTPYVAKDSSVELVDRNLQAREQAITMLKFHLKAAQDRMKTYADKKRSEREFAVGDWVYLKLQPYRQLTLRIHKQHKLSAKFFGPFKVLQKIGRVAYKLELPSTASIHPIFHVSLLKKCHSTDLSMGSLPLCDNEGSLAVVPYKILDRKLAKQGNRAVVYGLIQWANGSVEDATWELLTDIEKRFPAFVIDP
ncbi:retrotransposable element Tf2 [Tanacetum coccineum]|uniref:Retrotransposable element Tf2 n=1 Tax=Tanacetum coccineum TaxID=301880 RepID=A0ABQ5FTW7_9ASTR